MERGSLDETGRQKLVRATHAAPERFLDLGGIEHSHLSRHQPSAKIAVLLKLLCRHADDRCVSRQIDGVSDDGCRRICRRSCGRKPCYRTGDAEREAAPTPAAGCDPAYPIG